MKTVLGYFKTYYREEFRWPVFLAVLLFLTGTTWLFYTQKPVAALIGGGAAGSFRFFGNLLVFGVSFAVPLLIYAAAGLHRDKLRSPGFLLMAAVALLVFCFRVFFYWERPMAEYFSGDSHTSYWQNCLTNVTSAFLLVVPVFVFWLCTDRKTQPFYGISAGRVNWKPFVIFLAIMLPLILFAAHQPDFRAQYPKAAISLKRGGLPADDMGHALFFEGCYGLDFIATEFFFRGFLVIGLAKFLGRSAILPAAVFYTFIHFGKPLGETISSFAGGLALGIIAYETKSVKSGLILHLGIAWMIEAVMLMHNGAGLF
ncbi:MAG TPA: CPBP family intramembrane glutamic endopeptidase [Bacteroidia bacterium]|nr:CPBP family intramembrane glutamic endopeptidase [Bacteroidia bacterium]